MLDQSERWVTSMSQTRGAPRSSKFLTSESKLRHGDGREDFVMRTSASSYINDPFGHSSKEVLYKTRTVHIKCPHTHGKVKIEGGGLCFITRDFFFFFFWGRVFL